MSANVFVMGLDDANLEPLRRSPRLAGCAFHRLLTVEDLWNREGGADAEISFDDLLDKARTELDAFDGGVDAIVGYWDFPVSSLVPILCAERGLPAASLEAVATCEHKYWSRLQQHAVIEEVPGFALLDLDAAGEDGAGARLPEGLRYPVWLKPVKSASSELAFRAGDDDELRAAAARIRDGVGFLGGPFDRVLDRLDPPPEIAAAGGAACLVEEEAAGAQVTVEGYVHDGETHVYGIVDSIMVPGTPSFQRYQYPSALPEAVRQHIIELSERVVGRIGLNATPFNIEFFFDPDSGDVRLLEINPRLSQSHARLFEYVDGEPNHACMVELALGRAPRMPHRKGPYATAAKWFVRSFVADGVVRRAPTDEEIERVERDVDGVSVHLAVAEGDRLSELHGQDAYTYELAHVYVGAADRRELEDKYARALHALPFAIDTETGE